MFLLFPLEIVVDFGRPVANSPDVEAEGVPLLGSRADGEGMPLVAGYLGDADKNPVAGGKFEVGWAIY